MTTFVIAICLLSIGFSRSAIMISVSNLSPNHGTESGGTTVVISGDFTMTTPTTMQEMTPEYCNSMTIYDGTNPSAIMILNDPRGDGQDYQIARLADGNCWTLNNLKLGSTTSSIQLTQSDTNITSDFTLPQLVTTGTSYTDPVAYGPVPGDNSNGDITSDTFYGYLYNWCAVKGGDPDACVPYGTRPSSMPLFDICPSGWTLPAFTMFNKLNTAMMNSGSWTYPDQWLHNGPFKGVFSGQYSGEQGVYSYYYGSEARFFAGRVNTNLFRVNSVSAGGVVTDRLNLPQASVRCVADNTRELVVTFDGIPATIVSYDDNEIVVTTPQHAPGLVDVVVTRGATVTVADGFTYDPEYITVSSTPSASISIAPTPGGVQASTDVEIAVKTNANGYLMYISSDGVDNAMYHASLPDTISAALGTLAAPAALGVNNWGFSLSLPDLDQWIGVPVATNQLKIRETNAPNETVNGDVTKVYFGARVDTSKPSGNYLANVVFTSVTKP